MIDECLCCPLNCKCLHCFISEQATVEIEKMEKELLEMEVEMLNAREEIRMLEKEIEELDKHLHNHGCSGYNCELHTRD